MDRQWSKTPSEKRKWHKQKHRRIYDINTSCKHQQSILLPPPGTVRSIRHGSLYFHICHWWLKVTLEKLWASPNTWWTRMFGGRRFFGEDGSSWEQPAPSSTWEAAWSHYFRHVMRVKFLKAAAGANSFKNCCIKKECQFFLYILHGLLNDVLIISSAFNVLAFPTWPIRIKCLLCAISHLRHFRHLACTCISTK